MDRQSDSLIMKYVIHMYPFSFFWDIVRLYMGPSCCPLQLDLIICKCQEFVSRNCCCCCCYFYFPTLWPTRLCGHIITLSIQTTSKPSEPALHPLYGTFLSHRIQFINSFVYTHRHIHETHA